MDAHSGIVTQCAQLVKSKMDTQDSTATPSDAEIHDKLMAAANAADMETLESPSETSSSATKGDESAASKTEAAQPDEAKSDKTDNPESSAEKDAETQKSEETKGEQSRDEKGKFKKDEPKAEDDKAKEDSNYRRAKKEQERYDRNWKKLEERQQRVSFKEQELLQQEQRLQQQRSQSSDSSPKFDSRQYMLAAGEFDKRASQKMGEGDIDGAKEQLQLANDARQAAHNYAVSENAAAHQQFEQTWESHARSVVDEAPELADPNSDISKQMHALLQQEPVLAVIPDGFRKAYEALKLQRDAAEASGLRKELTKATKEIERLNKLVSPHGGKSAGGHSAPTSLSNLPLDKQREVLERQAYEADMV